MSRLLAAGALNEAQLLHLALCLREPALQALSEPGAVTDQALLPVALVGSSAADEAVAGGGLALSGGGPQLLVVQTTACVLRVLAALANAARQWLPARQAAHVLSALGLPALLRTLASAYVGAPPGSSYGCRALAVGLMQEVMAVLRGAASLPASEQVWARLLSQQQAQALMLGPVRTLH